MSPSPSDRVSQTVSHTAEYSPEERYELLSLAHRAIDARLRSIELEVDPHSAHFGEHRGAFTTLYLDGELRGCVGYVLPAYPLFRTIMEAAVAAAFNDIRFPPVTLEEAALLKIEISVLSPLFPISPEDIEIGRHGLVITYGTRRGLLLPQVPVEHGWGRETFLEQTCLKAGAPPDAWRLGALVEAFTAEVFGEL